jgi:hypothetical protein
VEHTDVSGQVLLKLGLLVENETVQLLPTVEAKKAEKHNLPARIGEGVIPACNGQLCVATMSNQNIKLILSNNVHNNGFDLAPQRQAPWTHHKSILGLYVQ